MFPEQRHRRLRRTETIRRMVRETHVRVDDLVYPMFVREGSSIEEPIASMPGQCRHSPDRLPALAKRLVRSGYARCSCSASRAARTRPGRRPSGLTAWSSRQCAA